MTRPSRPTAWKTFCAVDVETARREPGAICQFGLAQFVDGRLVDTRSLLIRPAGRYDLRHTQVHGLSEGDTRNAPTWREAYPEIARILHGQCVASHTLFDRKHMFSACCKSGHAMFSYRRWLDTHDIARRTWPDLQSYSLYALATHFGIVYRPHDAVEDARVAGQLLLLASGCVL